MSIEAAAHVREEPAQPFQGDHQHPGDIPAVDTFLPGSGERERQAWEALEALTSRAVGDLRRALDLVYDEDLVIQVELPGLLLAAKQLAHAARRCARNAPFGARKAAEAEEEEETP